MGTSIQQLKAWLATRAPDWDTPLLHALDTIEAYRGPTPLRGARLRHLALDAFFRLSGNIDEAHAAWRRFDGAVRTEDDPDGRFLEQLRGDWQRLYEARRGDRAAGLPKAETRDPTTRAYEAELRAAAALDRQAREERRAEEMRATAARERGMPSAAVSQRSDRKRRPRPPSGAAVRLGTAIEMLEHGLDRKAARRIALDHLRENPKAYKGRKMPPRPADLARERKAAERVAAALVRRVTAVAKRAERLARTFHAKRLRLTERMRSLQRQQPKPQTAVKIAELRGILIKVTKQHRDQLRELARSGACPPPPRSTCRNSCGLQLEGSYCGTDAPLVLPSPDGAPRRVTARYCITSADRLIASHDPITWQPRSDYPRDTQERRYEEDPSEQLKIVGISEHMRPEVIVNTGAGALEGPPVVTRSGLVAGGNGRTMGIQRAYRTGHGEVLRRYLRAHASAFGLTPEDVDKYAEPLVVRVVDVVPAALPRLVRDLNQATTQSLDPTAEAVSAARVLPKSALGALAEGLGEDEELSAFLGSPRSKPLVRALEEGGVITAANRNRLLDRSGLLSEDGRRLVTAQLAASLVPDARVLDDLGQVRQALARSAPWWLAASTGNYDVRTAFAAAARDLRELQRAELTPDQFRRQPALFGGGRHAAGSPLAETALDLLYSAGGKPLVMTRVARRYRQIAEALGSRPLLLAADEADRLTIDAQNSGRLPAPEEALRVAAEASGLQLGKKPR